jgi:zinc transporter, ZIP family
VLEAFALGLVAQSTLLIAGLIVCWIKVPVRVVGVLAGFGAGAMIAAIAFDLVLQAEALPAPEFAIWMFIGVALFIVGDKIVDRKFGDSGAGGAMGIVVGSVVDGVPESVIFGIQIGTGLAISPSFLAAVMVSNVPQAIAPSADLVASGWGVRRLAKLWGTVVLACGVAAALGYLATTVIPGVTGDEAAALAAGGLLAMLTNSLMPFAFERGGTLAGIATAVGFCLSVIGSTGS